jgi:glycerol-3-phosphate acyltransferase PlsX
MLCLQNGISLDGFSFIQAQGKMPVSEDPTKLLKEYADSSMAIGLKALAAGQGDAFVSAGSTGAMTVGANVIVGRAKGVKRCAIGTVIPNQKGCYMLVDVGANTECRPQMLVQFAIMGSVYMEKVVGITSPRVGLVNIGAEKSKGRELQQQAYELLEQAPCNFTGNVEPRYIPLGGCDVAVTDGFTGNVILKLTEGMGKFMADEITALLHSNPAAKAAAVTMKGELEEFNARLDYTEYGGAPILGAKKPVIKAHGSSNAKAIKNSLKQAKKTIEGDICAIIADNISAIKDDASE